MTSRWSALLIALLVWVVPSSILTQTAEAQETASDLSSLATCLRTQQALDVLLLFDESQSLDDTDPYDQRIGAAIALVRTLARMADTSADRPAPTIDVGVAGFGVTFKMAQTGGRLWNRLDPTSLSFVESSVSSFADRQTALDTDFFFAMQGAQRELARHAAAASAEGPHCQALVLFTDGEYSIDSKVEKSYAPGLDEAGVIKKGEDLLCLRDGVVDRLRDDGVHIISVALATDLSSGALTFIKSMAIGESAGRACGEAIPSGATFSASSSDGLLRVFDEIGNGIDDGSKVPSAEITARPCVDAPAGCRAEIPFFVDQAYERLHVLAEVVSGGRSVTGIEIELVPPEGTGSGLRASFSSGAATRTVAGAQAAYAWLSSNALDIDLRLPELVSSPESWTGTWMLRFWDTTGSAGSDVTYDAQIFVFGRFSPTLTRPKEFTLGEPSDIVVTLKDAMGASAADATVLAAAVLTGQVVAASSGHSQTLRFERQPDGTFLARGSLDDEFEPGQLEVRMSLSATIGSVALVPAPVVERVWLRPPLNYPNVIPEATHLGRVEGKDGASSPVTTTVKIVGGSDAGCVWFSLGEVASQPDGVRGIRLQATTTEDGPSSSADCPGFELQPQQTADVELTFFPDGAALGRLKADVVAHLKVVGGTSRERTLTLPYDMAMVLLPNKAVLWALFIGLFLVGLGGPIAFQYALAVRAARFEAPLGLWRAEIPVIVDPTGVTRDLGQPGGASPLTLDIQEDLRQNSDWTDERSREIDMMPILFRARTGPIPVLPPFGTASDTAGRLLATRTDQAPSEEARVPLQLANEWVFVAEPTLDQPKSPVGDASDSSGSQLRGTVYFLFERARARETQEACDEVQRALPSLIEEFIAREAELVTEGGDLERADASDEFDWLQQSQLDDESDTTQW